MEVTLGGRPGGRGTSRASAEPIELGAITNREKVLRERAEKEADLLSTVSPRAKQHFSDAWYPDLYGPCRWK